jgi:DNA-binding transcriptional MerR regulator
VAEPTPETPRRALLKSADVCEIIKVQPYVLRSWEKEFPDLGSTRTVGGPRFYRQSDVERVQRLKQLVFGEGLTIAGARRRLEEERGTPQADELPFEDELAATPVSSDMRQRIEGVRQTLRGLLEMLSAGPPGSARLQSTPLESTSSPGVNGDAAPAPEPIVRGRTARRRRADTAVNE